MSSRSRSRPPWRSMIFLTIVRPTPGAAAEFVAGVQAFEDPEDGLEMLFGDADAIVAHIEDGVMADETGRLPWASGRRGPGRCHGRFRSTVSGLSLYFIELVIRLRSTSPMRTRSPWMVGSGRGMRTSTPRSFRLIRNESSTSSRTSLRSVVRMAKSRRPTREKSSKRIEEHVHPLRQSLQRLQLLDALGIELVLVVFEQESRVIVNAPQRLFQIVRGDIRELVQFLVAAQQFGIAALKFPGDRSEVAPRPCCAR